MSAVAVESIFGMSEVKRRKAASSHGSGNPEPTLCIYFGAGRIDRVRQRAEAAGLSISGYVCHMVDGAELGAANLDKLELLAKLRGKPVAAVLADILTDVA